MFNFALLNIRGFNHLTVRQWRAWSKNNFTTSKCPSWDARIRDFLPWSLFASKTAPWSKSNCKTSKCPTWHAIIRVLRTRLVCSVIEKVILQLPNVYFEKLPLEISDRYELWLQLVQSNLTILKCPFWDARISVLPSWSFSSISAPLYKSNFKTFKWLFWDAKIRDVCTYFIIDGCNK